MAGGFDHWCVVEMMGHVRTAGRVTEEDRFGTTMGRCDVPGESESFTTFYFNGTSVYRLTPCTEDAARAVAKRCQPEPVHEWEYVGKKAISGPNDDDDEDDEFPCGLP